MKPIRGRALPGDARPWRSPAGGDHRRRPDTGSSGSGPAGRTWAGPGPDEQILDGSLQNIVGREADSIRHTPSRQRFIQGRKHERRVGSDDDGLPPDLGPLNDLEQDPFPTVRTVDIAWPERGGQAVAVLIEDEERMVADGLEVAIVS